MAHELDMTTGRPAIAFRGAVPWHGLGETIQPGDDLDTIRYKAGLEYHVDERPVYYESLAFDAAGQSEIKLRTVDNRKVLVRSDTNDALSVVGHKYCTVQPAEILDFYRNLVDQYGFQIEVVGALRGGRKVWALANTNEAVNLRGEDKVKGYLLLATSYDSTMATQARFTSVRVVCNNTLSMARSEGKANVTVPHSTAFNAASVQTALNIGPVWSEFSRFANYAAQRKITMVETGDLILRTYFDLKEEELESFIRTEDTKAKADKVYKRLTDIIHSAPGAGTESALGTLWGVLNAITYDVDHSPGRVRNRDVQLDRAWFGDGERIKQRAKALAEELV